MIREHPVMLNRAPTLHRLGIQAFEPKLIEGKAIQLHPLVCTAFNADFDGDQMAVHVPLSLEAQLEARVLMMSTNNILSPANGKPIIVPSQDIVLGLYYLSHGPRTASRAKARPSPTSARSKQALDAGVVTPAHQDHGARSREIDEDGKPVHQGDRDHAGPDEDRRAAAAPPADRPSPGRPRLLTKKEIANLIDVVYRHCGQKETVIFADQIMGLGFREAAKAGISFGKDDIIIPERKKGIVDETRKLVEEYEQQYADGLITQRRKVQQGGRRLGQGHRPRRRRDDGGDLDPQEGPERPRAGRSTRST